jgi:hypothetical protein
MMHAHTTRPQSTTIHTPHSTRHDPIPPRFADAAEIYEDVARACADNNLLKFGARGHLLCAGVCVLCHANDEDIRGRIERYKDIDLQVGV